MQPQQHRTFWHRLSRIAPKTPSTRVVTPPRMARISAVLLTMLPIAYLSRRAIILAPYLYTRQVRMDIDSINGGTPATKQWLAPVCGNLHAHDIYADHLYLTDGGSGIPGPPGPQGEQGEQGPPGQSASIAVESVTTGAPGSAVIFQNVGAGPSAAFVVSIPRGDPGVG